VQKTWPPRLGLRNWEQGQVGTKLAFTELDSTRVSVIFFNDVILLNEDRCRTAASLACDIMIMVALVYNAQARNTTASLEKPYSVSYNIYFQLEGAR
jgi:hypothetical protein